MKKVKKCDTENCIPTLSSCVEWNGGSIEYLGICDGDSLNTLIWEVITKLEDIAGDDLSEFDIDSLLDICNQKAPNEVTILSILNLLKNNQVCLKDFINNLEERLNELFANTGVSVNLKCYQEFDNLGNSLSITRETLDQLIIDNLCAQKQRIETLEGKVVSLQSQIDNINSNTTVDELSFGTCINAAVLPTSSQVIQSATAFCDLRTATGTVVNISQALAHTPNDLNTEFGGITGWINAPANWAQNYGNLLLEVQNLRSRLNTIEDTCCKLTCEDVKLGFSAVFNEDNDGIIITFTYGAGTVIPAGFTDKGSHGTITDQDGNVVDFNLTIANNSTHEIGISGLSLAGNLAININAALGTSDLTCQKCLNRVVSVAGCRYCELTAVGDGEVTIIYESDVNYGHGDGGGTIIYATTTTTTSGV